MKFFFLYLYVKWRQGKAFEALLFTSLHSSYKRPSIGLAHLWSRALGRRLQFFFLPLVDRYASSVFKPLMWLMHEQLHLFGLVSLSLNFCVKITKSVFWLSVKSTCMFVPAVQPFTVHPFSFPVLNFSTINHISCLNTALDFMDDSKKLLNGQNTGLLSLKLYILPVTLPCTADNFG